MTNKSSYPIPYHPTWDWMDSSKLKCYSTCERMFFYKYVCGYDSRTKSRHLVIGDAWHKMMEIIGLTNTVENFDDVLIALSKNQWTSVNIMEAAHQTCMEHPTLRRAVEAAFDICYTEIADTTWAMYADTWAPKIPGRLPLALITYIMLNREHDSAYEMILSPNGTPMMEVGCQFVFEGTSGITMLMKARWDKVVRNKITNTIMVREHKTSGNLNNFSQEWELAIQPSTYAAAMRMFFPIGEQQDAIVEMDGLSFAKTKLDVKKDAVDPFRHNNAMRCQVRKAMKGFRIWYGEVDSRIEALFRDYTLLDEAKETDPVLWAFPMRTNSCHNQYGTPCPFVTYCQAYANPLEHIRSEQMLENFTIRFWNPDEQKPPKVTLVNDQSTPPMD